MAFDTLEELTLLTQSVDAFLADTCDTEILRKTVSSESGWRPDWWRRLAEELGVLGVGAPEALGGMAAPREAVAAVAEAFGWHMAVEPFLQSVIMTGELLKDGGDAAEALMARVVAGEAVIAPALLEAQSRYNLLGIETAAVADGDGWRLTGRKVVVRAAPWAETLIVSAMADREPALFLVETSAPGVTLIPYRTFDGQQAADVILDAVPAAPDARIDAAVARLRRAFDVAVVMQGFQAVGTMRRVMEGTRDYLLQRQQFGTPIGGFQALRHRLADMAMALERAAALLATALEALDREEAERARAASRARLAVDQACRLVGEGAVQMHGAIGLTDELFISHAFKRLVVFQTELGDTDFHAARAAA